MQTILIIGAGFSGAVTAVQLLRRANGKSLRVILLNRSGRMARGLAYGTQSAEHALNVPAGNMSALVDDPEHFLRAARSIDPSIGRSSFVRRNLYGDYLECLLDTAEQTCQPNIMLERITGEVETITMHASGKGGAVRLADGQVFAVDQIVLAFGHFPAVEPPIEDGGFYASARYIGDPWNAAAIEAIPAHAPVLLLGSGLTAVDVATILLNQNPARAIHVLSRRGLLPKTHRIDHAPPSRFALPSEFDKESVSVRELLRAFRVHAAKVTAAGEDWREALNALRPRTHKLWQALSNSDRRRFLRHVQPYWDNHRHRAAPATHSRFESAIANGAIRVHAGRILAVDQVDDGLAVRYRARAADDSSTLRAQYVINCIGPSSDLHRVDNKLVRQLLGDGLIRADALRLGLDVADNGAVIGASGTASASLFYVGPLLKARDWEATAVPELRRFAAAMADTLLALD